MAKVTPSPRVTDWVRILSWIAKIRLELVLMERTHMKKWWRYTDQWHNDWMRETGSNSATLPYILHPWAAASDKQTCEVVTHFPTLAGGLAWENPPQCSVVLCFGSSCDLKLTVLLHFSQLHPMGIFSSTVWCFLFYSKCCCEMLELHTAEFPSQPLLSSSQECTIYVIISSVTP